MAGMSLFEWKSDYSVGNAQIDLQHKQLFRMAKELHGAMVNGRGAEVVEALLDQVVSYTCHHFASEERLMKESDYPDYAAHHASHEKLAGDVRALQAKVKERKVAVTLEMMRFLRDWLDHHIRGADMKVGAHLKSRLTAGIHQ